MRLSELSKKSGVSTATIKYYLREGLLPPGERISTNQADYHTDHLHRLRLVRALIHVGRIPVARAREVLASMDEDKPGTEDRVGAAIEALPYEPVNGSDGDAFVVRAQGTVAALLAQEGWAAGARSSGNHPAYQMLVDAVATLDRLGYPCDVPHLTPYAARAAELAVHDLNVIQDLDSPEERVEAAVALTVLYEPLLLALRRLAGVEECRRRYNSA
ncbi:MerR family transcriptional regulator [Streptomyces hydrogenans]|uniref:MerR family transcriptional regulator n=1 Tax=Streptomyces hydrogenans TaxID=1873719 RepID=UPI00364CFD6A